MYRIFTNKPGARYSFARKIMLIMRLTTIILIASLMQLSAATFGQRITLSERNVPLEKIFREIRKQSGYAFYFNRKLISTAKNVDVNLSNASIDEAMQLALRGLPLSYSIEDKTVLIKEKASGLLDKLSTVISNIARDLTVKGRVVDQDGKPLPNASIRVRGKNTVTNTNQNGEFEIKDVADDAVLLVSYVGYKTLEIPVKGAIMPLEIKLNVAAGELEEVNVNYNTGYQNIPKERSTGSFEFVDNKLLNRRVSSNIIDRLEGITGSVAFNKDPRLNRTEISVRGRSTIFSNAVPLIVVDNYPYEGDINNINPNDIENVTILKDAAAASVWGTRAGNGVIVITTKSGKLNQRTTVDFTSNVTIDEKPDLFYIPKIGSSDVIDIETILFSKGHYDNDILNTYEFPALSPVVEILLKARNGEISRDQANQQIDLLRQIDVRNDYQKYSYKNNIANRHSVNISGGSGKMAYYFSSGYDKNVSPFKDISERFTSNLKSTIELTPKLTINIAGFVSRSLNKQGTLPKIFSYPYERIVDDEGNGLIATYGFRNSFKSQAVQKGFLDWTFNPFEDAKLNNNKLKNNNLSLNVGTTYKIFSFLAATLNYQFQQQEILNTTLFSPESYYVRDLINRYSQVDPITGAVSARPIPTGGMLQKENNRLTTNNVRLQLNFEKKWGNHQVSAISGFEINQAESSSDQFTAYGYDEKTTLSKPVNYNTYYTSYPLLLPSLIPGFPTLVSGNLDRFRSIYFNAAYSFMERYHFTLSARNDASNYFGVKTNQRSVPLWSAGMKYDLDEESFYKLNWLPTLKLRLTYGYTGNINKNVSALTTIQYFSGTPPYNLPKAQILNPPNPSLKWETASIFNLGLDFGAKNSIVTGSIEFYTKRGNDLIGDGPLDGTTGIITINGDARFRGNIASMKAKGIDISVNTLNINQNFKWTSYFLFSYNRDKVTEYNFKPTLTNILTSGLISPIVGEPLYALHSYRWGGLDPNTGDPQGFVNGQISKDYTLIANPDIEDLVYSGPTRPSYFGAVRNQFSYKGLSISANITYKLGYVFRNNTLDYNNLFQSPQLSHADYYKRWQKPGDEKTTNVPSMVYPAASASRNFYVQSEAFVEKGDHIRLQDISFGYDFRYAKSRWKWVKSLSINGYISNLGVLWKSSDKIADPDFVSFYPNPRSYSLGITAQF